MPLTGANENRESVATVQQGLPKGTAGAVNGAEDYCHAANKCEKGEGDCDSNSHCVAGTVCINDMGPKWGLTPGLDVCAPEHCRNGILDSGETAIDCGGPDCGTCLDTCTGAPGAPGFCTGCVCSSGQGDCARDADCLPGLVCSRVGMLYGWGFNTDACVPAHCANSIFDHAFGEVDIDCGGDCAPCVPNCSGHPGAEPFCVGCRCQAGQGDCDTNDHCQRGLTCQSNTGSQYNQPYLNDTCAAPHCDNGVLDAAAGETLIDCGGPCGACGVTDFDAGTRHACDISQGRVRCWGYNLQGQLGNDTTVSQPIPGFVANLDATQVLVTAGGSHSCALSSSGGVLKCWGKNDFGQLGKGTADQNLALVPGDAVVGAPSTIQQLVSGENHVCVRSNGIISCWGQNDKGQLGNGAVGGHQAMPVAVAGITTAVHVSAGLNHTCAALADGTVRCWGDNTSKKLGDNSADTESGTPRVAAGVVQAIQVSTGDAHSCALRSDGRVYCWGNNAGNRLGLDVGGVPNGGNIPAIHPGLTAGVSIGSTANSTCISASNAGQYVWCWGAGTQGQVGAGNTLAVSGGKLLLANRTNFVKGGGDFACSGTVVEPGIVRCWGNDHFGQLGKGTVAFQATPEVVWPPPAAASSVDAGHHSTCAVAGGQVYCWGQNDTHQLGDGTQLQRRVPTLVSGITTATSVAVGNFHACATLSDGTIRCWGSNVAGQFGNGTTNNVSAVPVSSNATSAVHVEAGTSTTCALHTNGSISCWGQGSEGQFGNNAAVNSSTPVNISLSAGAATAISVGMRHVCAIADGNVYCWGSNNSRQASPQDIAEVLVPTQVVGLSNIVSIAAGHNHTCAVAATGKAYCWGLNDDGQLSGSYTASSAPVEVAGISNARRISAWGSFTCATLATGELRCWGQNTRGQLGSGIFEARNFTPQAVPGVWSFISAGGRHACGILTSGQIRCWGYNDYGQLGNNKAWIFPEPATAVPASPPGAQNTECFSNADCSHGQVCWLQQGPRFDLAQGTNVCVNAECMNTPTPSCGTAAMKCGKCDNQPRVCDGTPGACHFGETCGTGNGASLGLAGNTDVCWSAGCEDALFRAANCGAVDSTCGLCPVGAVICTTNEDCPSGQVCGLGAGPRFGHAVGTNVCWAADPCSTDTAATCGSTTLACGLCGEREPGCESDANCIAGLDCWVGGGPSFGLDEGTNVCAQPRCVDGTATPEDCSGLAAPCGDCGAAPCPGDPEGPACRSFDPVDTQFTYDALGRLTAVAQNGTTREGYGYDRAGNRCTVSIGPVAEVNGYCAGSEVNEHYTSAWATSGSEAASYADEDGTFTLTWTLLPQTVELRLSHEPPGLPVSIIDLNADTVSQSYTHAASGLHRFVLYACFIEYDINNDPVTNCQSYMRFDITVN